MSMIYLDYNATTPPFPEVLHSLTDFVSEWGNPSSIHWASRKPKSVLRNTRQVLAQALGVSPLELVFTSGGSESNNAVIKSFAGKSAERNEFITTQVEHPSVIKTFRWLESQGAKVHYLPVHPQSGIDLEKFLALLSAKTALVSVMFANNETGMIFPIKKMAKLAHASGAYFHSDCVQALGKLEFNLEDLGIDYASFSAHKFYALKGTGFLYIKKNSPFEPLIHGGGQERHRRGGTENTLGISALGLVASKLATTKVEMKRMSELRNQMEEKILAMIPEVTITARQHDRLSNTSSLVIPGIDGETLLMSLDLKGFAVSTGAACSSGSPEPSPVLLALGLSREQAQSSLRISIGWMTTQSELDQFTSVLAGEVSRLRGLRSA